MSALVGEPLSFLVIGVDGAYLNDLYESVQIANCLLHNLPFTSSDGSNNNNSNKPLLYTQAMATSAVAMAELHSHKAADNNKNSQAQANKCFHIEKLLLNESTVIDVDFLHKFDSIMLDLCARQVNNEHFAIQLLRYSTLNGGGIVFSAHVFYDDHHNNGMSSTRPPYMKLLPMKLSREWWPYGPELTLDMKSVNSTRQVFTTAAFSKAKINKKSTRITPGYTTMQTRHPIFEGVDMFSAGE